MHATQESHTTYKTVIQSFLLLIIPYVNLWWISHNMWTTTYIIESKILTFVYFVFSFDLFCTKAPNPPINVTFIETGSTQLRVVWMPPEENLAFNINCYLVYIRPTFIVFSHFQKFNICHSNVCDIKSLLPGVNYTVYVESFDLTYGLRSLPSNYITAVTYPDSKLSFRP